MRPQTERLVRREEEADGCVLLTHGPTTDDLAQSARDLLTVSKDHHGTEQHDGFLKDPVMVHSLFLKKPERIEAWGRVLVWALWFWRVRERAMRRHVDATSPPWMGWDTQATDRPTAFMMVTKCVGVIVVKRGNHGQLARPLSVVQPQYLTALAVPVACFTACQSGEGNRDDDGPPLPAAEAYPALVGC